MHSSFESDKYTDEWFEKETHKAERRWFLSRTSSERTSALKHLQELHRRIENEIKIRKKRLSQ